MKSPYFLLGGALLILGCKPRSLDSSGVSDASVDFNSALVQKEIDRINGSCNEAQVKCRQGWRDYVLSKGPFNKSSYEDLWRRYAAFITFRGEQGHPKAALIKSYTVNLYLSSQQIEYKAFGAVDARKKDEQAKIAGTKDLATEGRSSETIGEMYGPIEIEEPFEEQKICFKEGSPILPPLKLSYKLLVEPQPALSRNFLVLTKMGYFDGKFIDTFETWLMLYFPALTGIVEPFFIRPDIYYTPRPDVVYNERRVPASARGDIDLRDLASSPSAAQGRGLKSQTPFGNLIGMVINDIGHPDLRKVRGAHFGISLYDSGGQELDQNFDKNGLYPVTFGVPVVDAKNDVARLVRKMVADIRKNILTPDKKPVRNQFKIECVEILVPETEPWPREGSFAPFRE